MYMKHTNKMIIMSTERVLSKKKNVSNLSVKQHSGLAGYKAELFPHPAILSLSLSPTFPHAPTWHQHVPAARRL